MGFNSDMGQAQAWGRGDDPTREAAERQRRPLPKSPTEATAREALALLAANPGVAFNATGAAKAATDDELIIAALGKVQSHTVIGS